MPRAWPPYSCRISRRPFLRIRSYSLTLLQDAKFFTLSLVVLAVCVRRADRFPKITWLPSIIIQLLQKVSDREDRHAKEIRFKDADDAVKVAVQQ